MPTKVRIVRLPRDILKDDLIHFNKKNLNRKCQDLKDFKSLAFNFQISNLEEFEGRTRRVDLPDFVTQACLYLAG